MKSYTDIEQSRKLAEILPIESADMKFPYFGDGQYGTTALFGEPIEFSGGKDIPCWSLNALLYCLPNNIDQYTKSLYWYNNDWNCEYVDEHLPGILGTSANDAIDACYEMILKLHKQKLL